ncbi:MAG: nucleotidyl transferase AbiEii/AbiGii toxin family protein [Actinomycetota bacterium]
MRYASAAAFRTALEQRLLNQSRETGASLVRLRKTVVFDRLLTRLKEVAPGRWILKGALALDFRLGPRTRTTKDMDLARADDEEAATADFIAAQAVQVDDFFSFTVEKARDLGERAEGAVRYHVRAELAGRLFEDAIVDVGFSDALPETIDRLRGPDLLSFAEIEPVEVPALPLEQHVAEKVHAYTRTYGTGLTSTRVKDLVDLVLVKSFASLDAERLHASLLQTFQRRRQQTLPERLPPPPADWAPAYRKFATELGLDSDLGSGHSEAGALIDPVLAGRVAGRWSPDRSAWADDVTT